MTQPTLPSVAVRLDDAERSRAASRLLATHLREEAEVVTDPEVSADVSIVSPAHAPLTAPGPGRTVILCDAGDLNSQVLRMAEQPWLDHVIGGDFVADPALLERLGVAIRTILRGTFGSTPFLGRNFHGRKSRARDSSTREQRIESVLRVAREAEARSSVLERIHDVTEELITNALYDAPASRFGAFDRTVPRVLEREHACELTYGTDGRSFFVRARDPFGSLTRQRLFEVLGRCARGMADVDQSHGGAGLGLWRIFNAAELVLIRVRPQALSEVVVGLHLKRPQRPTDGRTVHLFFDPPHPVIP